MTALVPGNLGGEPAIYDPLIQSSESILGQFRPTPRGIHHVTEYGAIRFDQKYLYIITFRSFLHDLANDYYKARADYDKAIELNPWDINSRVNRAQCFIAQEEFEKALADLDEVVRLGIKDHPVNLTRARLYYEREELEKELS